MIVPETKGFVDEGGKTGDCSYSMTFRLKDKRRGEFYITIGRCMKE